MRDDLLDFIASARAKSVADSTILLLLRSQGWSERRAQDALAAYYAREFGLSVPTAGGRAENARDAFFYLLSFFLLGVWSSALVWLGDILIDRWIPSALDEVADSFTLSAISWQIAGLVVALAAFILINMAFGRELRERPEAYDSGVRKWLTYVVLAATAACLVSDGVWFLASFLEGDLSARFFAKAALLLLVSGGIFWYYLRAIRANRPLPALGRAFGAAAVAIALVFMASGFIATGSPQHARDRASDEKRKDQMRSLNARIVTLYQAKHHIPATLADIPDEDKHDPVTGQPFGYQARDARHYRLCAQFLTEKTTPLPGDRTWDHPAGKACISLDAEAQ